MESKLSNGVMKLLLKKLMISEVWYTKSELENLIIASKFKFDVVDLEEVQSGMIRWKIILGNTLKLSPDINKDGSNSFRELRVDSSNPKYLYKLRGQTKVN